MLHYLTQHYEAAWYSYSFASFLPRSTSTLIRIGTASQIIKTRKKNAYRIFPVRSDMMPTTRGPINELDCMYVYAVNDRSSGVS